MQYQQEQISQARRLLEANGYTVHPPRTHVQETVQPQTPKFAATIEDFILFVPLEEIQRHSPQSY